MVNGTTPTERSLGMSLPSDLRDLPPEEVVSGQTLRAGSSRLRSGGGGRRVTPPAPTFESSLLKQSFPSQSALQKAESEFKVQQTVRARAEEVRQASAEERRIGGQITLAERPTGFLKGPTFDVRRRTEEVKLRALEKPGPNIKERGLLLGLGFTSTLLKFPGEVSGLARGLVTEPVTTVKAIPSGIKQSLLGIVRELKSPTPEAAIGGLIAEGFLLKGTGKAIKTTGKGVELGRTVLSPRFRAVQSRELTQFGTTERFITIPSIGGTGEIGLIPAGLERSAQTLRPTVRGGFGFTAKEQTAFLKQPGPIVTAQRGFEGFGAPLERELFATPPLGGRGFVRISRLGVQQQEASVLDILRGKDITFKRPKPQILVFPEEAVGRRGGFQPQLKGTELETVLPAGRVPIRTGQPGVTVVEGGRVPIITAKIGKVTPETTSLISRSRAGEGLSRAQVGRISRETGFDIRSTAPGKPFFPSTRVAGSTGLSISKTLRPTTRLTSRGLGVSFPTTAIQTRRVSPPTGIIPSFPTGPIPTGSLSGPSISLTTVSTPISGPVIAPVLVTVPATAIISTREPSRRKKSKKTKKRKVPRTPVGVSFTASTLGLTGKFPSPKIKGLGLLPTQIRVLPTKRKPKRR